MPGAALERPVSSLGARGTRMENQYETCQPRAGCRVRWAIAASPACGIAFNFCKNCMRDVLALPLFATLATEGAQGRGRATVEQRAEGVVLERMGELERFLASVEQRAFRIARITLRDDDDALDAVQDAMLKLAKRYASHPAEQWRPLFYRILQNRVRDFQRRRQVRNRIFAWLPALGGGEEPAADLHDITPAPGSGPIEKLMADQALAILERAVHELPLRQQQAFLLRNFEGLDVAATASAMSCSEGSVKTHYFRAVHTLRARLGEAW